MNMDFVWVIVVLETVIKYLVLSLHCFILLYVYYLSVLFRKYSYNLYNL